MYLTSTWSNSVTDFPTLPPHSPTPDRLKLWNQYNALLLVLQARISQCKHVVYSQNTFLYAQNTFLNTQNIFFVHKNVFLCTIFASIRMHKFNTITEDPFPPITPLNSSWRITRVVKFSTDWKHFTSYTYSTYCKAINSMCECMQYVFIYVLFIFIR